ncbi:MAG: trypsin-like serine peptidase [Streptosporangiaceae bacterium]
MRLRGLRPALIGLTVAAAVVVGVALSPPARSSITIPGHLATYGQKTTIGALFTLSPSGQLQNHFCTASVVDSPAGDLAVTAAHCMQGQLARQVAFVPDYSAGHAPYGAWTVTQVIEDGRWRTSGDADDDFAFLVVAQPGSTVPVEDRTGGETLGISTPAEGTVEVAGYPDTVDTMVSCENTVAAVSPTQFEFDCDGFTDGTSGSPLLAQGVPFGATGEAATDGVDMVIGVIGGYEQGGYTASVSYAARFAADLAALYQRAVLVSAGSAG